MRERLAAGAVLLGSLLTGCGIYSVRTDPAPLARPASPVELSVSLGDVRTVVDGRAVAMDAATLDAIDADFTRAARASGLFARVLPWRSHADLEVDTVRQLFSPRLSAGRTVFLVLAGPLLLAPGFPVPWDYRIGREVTLRGQLDGTTFPLGTQATTYDQRVWGATYLGAHGFEPLRESEGDYLFALVAQALADRRSVYDGFAGAVRTGDVESAWLMSVQAAATAPVR